MSDRNADVRFDAMRLNHEIASRGLTGKSLAGLTGLDQNVISNARRGQPIRPKSMRAILTALGKVPALPGSELLA